MKKSKLIATAVLASTLGLAGCGNGAQQCKHVDEKAPWHYCDLCNAKLSEHTFGEWSVKVAPTFEAEGVEHRVCTYPNCGEEETRAIAKLEHTYSNEWSSDNEKHWHACTDVGYENLRKDEAAHSVEEWSEYSPADFEHKKVEHGFCSECAKECFREVGDVVPHNFEEDWTSDEDNHWHKCIDEGYEELRDGEAPHADADDDHYCDVCERQVSEHEFSDDWSYADGYHFHECEHSGCDEITGSEEHIDLDTDGFCDTCEAQMPAYTSITLDYLTGYIGAGESVVIRANVEGSGDFRKDVDWHIEKSNGASWTSYPSKKLSDIFTLDVNEDGSATVSGVMAEYLAEFSCYVYATAKGDPSVSSNPTEKIFYQTWNNTKRSTLNSFFGSGNWQAIPFFPSCTLTKTGDTLTGTGSGRSLQQMINSFDNQGKWTKISTSEDNAVYQMDSLQDKGIYFECEIVKNDTKANFTITTHQKVLDKFPIEIVNEYIEGKTESDFVEPDDGTVFTYSTKNGMYVYSNGNKDAYATKLAENGFYVVPSGARYTCVSAERTLSIGLQNDDDGMFRISVDTKDAPKDTDWSSSAKNKMTSFIGEVIPFIPNDYGNWYEYEGSIYTSSTKVEAGLVAEEVLDSHSEYAKSIDSGVVRFAKDIDELSYYIIRIEGTNLYIDIAPKPTDQWLGNKIADAIGCLPTDFPAATGTSFLYSFDDGAASVEVTGGSLSEYKVALAAAGYQIVERTVGYSTKVYAVSSDTTIVIELVDGAAYTLNFSRQDPLVKNDWTTADKDLMNSYIGEVLPFVQAEYGDWYDNISYGGYIYTMSSRIESQQTAKAVFDADLSYTASSISGGYEYSKNLGKYQKLRVDVLSSQIQAYVEDVQLTTWEADDIALGLGPDAMTVLPQPGGESNKYTYSFGENSVKIKVISSSSTAMGDYQTVLEGKGFSTSDGSTYVSGDGTVTAALERVTGKTFYINASGHLPAGYSRNWPIAEITKALAKDPGLEDLPTPVGTMFYFNQPDKYMCDVGVIEGGNRSDYESALDKAGFVLSDTTYTKGNIGVRLSNTPDDGYMIHIYLIEEPVITDWSDEIKTVIANIFEYCWVSADPDELPYPDSATSVQKVSDKSFLVYGLDMESYKKQLSDAGFSTKYYDSYGEYDITYSGDYYSFYIMDQNDGSYLFTYTYW